MGEIEGSAQITRQHSYKQPPALNLSQVPLYLLLALASNYVLSEIQGNFYWPRISKEL